MDGAKIQVKQEIMQQFYAVCSPEVTPIVVADRGFGNERWIEQIANWGWRLYNGYHAGIIWKTGYFIGVLLELGIRRT